MPTEGDWISILCPLDETGLLAREIKDFKSPWSIRAYLRERVTTQYQNEAYEEFHDQLRDYFFKTLKLSDGALAKQFAYTRQNFEGWRNRRHKIGPELIDRMLSGYPAAHSVMYSLRARAERAIAGLVPVMYFIRDDVFPGDGIEPEVAKREDEMRRLAITLAAKLDHADGKSAVELLASTLADRGLKDSCHSSEFKRRARQWRRACLHAAHIINIPNS